MMRIMAVGLVDLLTACAAGKERMAMLAGANAMGAGMVTREQNESGRARAARHLQSMREGEGMA